MRTLLIPAFLGLGLAVTGCSAPQHAAADDGLLMELVGRDRTIAVYAGDDGPRYSVIANDGSVLVPAMSADDLARNHPELHRQIKRMRTQETVMLYWAGD